MTTPKMPPESRATALSFDSLLDLADEGGVLALRRHEPAMERLGDEMNVSLRRCFESSRRKFTLLPDSTVNGVRAYFQGGCSTSEVCLSVGRSRREGVATSEAHRAHLNVSLRPMSTPAPHSKALEMALEEGKRGLVPAAWGAAFMPHFSAPINDLRAFWPIMGDDARDFPISSKGEIGNDAAPHLRAAISPFLHLVEDLQILTDYTGVQGYTDDEEASARFYAVTHRLIRAISAAATVCGLIPVISNVLDNEAGGFEVRVYDPTSAYMHPVWWCDAMLSPDNGGGVTVIHGSSEHHWTRANEGVTAAALGFGEVTQVQRSTEDSLLRIVREFRALHPDYKVTATPKKGLEGHKPHEVSEARYIHEVNTLLSGTHRQSSVERYITFHLGMNLGGAGEEMVHVNACAKTMTRHWCGPKPLDLAGLRLLLGMPPVGDASTERAMLAALRQEHHDVWAEISERITAGTATTPLHREHLERAGRVVYGLSRPITFEAEEP